MMYNLNSVNILSIKN